MRWKPTLNAFAITFEGGIVPTPEPISAGYSRKCQYR
jgi:hypothetical protein